MWRARFAVWARRCFALDVLYKAARLEVAAATIRKRPSEGTTCGKRLFVVVADD
jgi:hypothetical protein